MLFVSSVNQFFQGLSARRAAAQTDAASTPRTGDVAHGLLYDAQALAGTDPHEAQRLRSAARAYLSVIR